MPTLACSSSDASAPAGSSTPDGSDAATTDPTPPATNADGGADGHADGGSITPPKPPSSGPKPGDLDTTWGATGSIAVPGSFFYSSLGDMIAMPGGKVLVSGGVDSHDFVGPAFVARFDGAGAIDATFGSAGVASPVGVADGKAYAAALRLKLAGSRVFAAVSYDGPGNAAAPVRVLALNATDGALDTTFATSGATTDSVSTEHYEWTPATLDVLANGNIVVGGYGYISLGFVDAVVMRFQPSGALDTTFTKLVYPGTDRETRGPVGVAYPTAVLPLASGKLLTLGYRSAPSSSGTSPFDQMIDVKSDTTDAPTYPVLGAIRDAQAAADGSVFAIGDVTTTSATTPNLLHLTTLGALDAAFGTGGYLPLPTPCNAERMAIAPDGKLLVSGRCIAGNSVVDSAVVRLLPSGALDTTFGKSGVVKLPLLTVARVLVQADGKVLVYGATATAATIVRLVP